MRIGFSISTNSLTCGNENGFKSVSIVGELGPFMLGLYRWPVVRGNREAYWSLSLTKTWAHGQDKVRLYPFQEAQ